jgi:hypothetical protein
MALAQNRVTDVQGHEAPTPLPESLQSARTITSRWTPLSDARCGIDGLPEKRGERRYLMLRPYSQSEIGFMAHGPRPPRITPVTPLFLNNSADSVRPRVLIVDDQENVRVAIASLLAKRGCDAVMAESGHAALERVRAEYFDVLLCDVKMPGMSGLEFLSEAMLLPRSSGADAVGRERHGDRARSPCTRRDGLPAQTDRTG